jgi:hypothetical protein
MLVHTPSVTSGNVSGEQDPMLADEDDKEYDEDFDDLPSRYLRPRYLCFLNEKVGFTRKKVKLWLGKEGPHASLEYLFVSFAHKQIDPRDSSNRRGILKIAEMAARKAQVKGFWIDFECMPGHTKYEDVYRICDVVRAAHSLIVVLPSPRGQKSLDDLLNVWGDRMWTLPELLLCHSKHKINVYFLDRLEPETELEKRNFAVNAWKDAKNVRQLIDHFESSLPLTALEIVTIALQCLQTRLDIYMTYILMDYSDEGLQLMRKIRTSRHLLVFLWQTTATSYLSDCYACYLIIRTMHGTKLKMLGAVSFGTLFLSARLQA